MTRPFAFHGVWRFVQIVLVVSVLAALYFAFDEYSLRRYLKGFSDAVVPLNAPPDQKVEAILTWMRTGPARRDGAPDDYMANRDPQDTLNYGQLLKVCGTATNAFLNLALSGGLPARRLLLQNPDHGAKHVVAEVQINGQWIVADPTLRTLFRDASGHFVTRSQLAEPAMLAEVTRNIPDYPANYTYERTAHVHLRGIPIIGGLVRRALDAAIPGWEESLNWTMPLERRSLGLMLLALLVAVMSMLVNLAMGWYAHTRLGIQRITLRSRLKRFGQALFSTSH
jgi:hypothetical protein